MPLVRITHAPGVDAVAVSRVVHGALQAHFAVPADDYFHLLEELGPERRLLRSDGYLGHGYTERFTLVEITCSSGRDLQQKKALYAAVAAGAEAEAGLRPDDVTVILTENRREDWCFGGGTAAYA